MINTKGRLSYFAFIVIFLSANSYSTSLPNNAVLEYETLAGGINLGVVKRSLKKEGNVYKGSSVTEQNAMAKLIYSTDVEEHCEFKIDQGTYVPISYHSIRRGSKPHDNKATFKDNTVTYANQSSSQEKGILMDQGCFVYAFMVMGPKAFDGKVISLNDASKSRTFKLLSAKDMKISTEAGDYDVVEIQLQRLDKEGQLNTIWIDKLTGVPVKSQYERASKPTTTLELKKPF